MNSAISLALLMILVALPVLFACTLHRNRDKLTDEEMRQKIGSLYLGMNVRTAGQRLYSSVFLFRRLMYGILTIACINNPNILIHVFLANNILYIMYMGQVSPNETQVSRRMEFFNECLL